MMILWQMLTVGVSGDDGALSSGKVVLANLMVSVDVLVESGLMSVSQRLGLKHWERPAHGVAGLRGRCLTAALNSNRRV
jgi:hypothetical protein